MAPLNTQMIMLLVHTLNKELSASQTAFSKSTIRASFQTHTEVGVFEQVIVHLVEAPFNNRYSNPADMFASQFNSSSNSALYFKPLMTTAGFGAISHWFST